MIALTKYAGKARISEEKLVNGKIIEAEERKSLIWWRSMLMMNWGRDQGLFSILVATGRILMRSVLSYDAIFIEEGDAIKQKEIADCFPKQPNEETSSEDRTRRPEEC